ncbi:MAG TPA: phage major capsid protein [Planctomycetaceae bacterium]|nr:phage major capsid protein [Planctomycetaceae bacterium]
MTKTELAELRFLAERQIAGETFNAADGTRYQELCVKHDAYSAQNLEQQLHAGRRNPRIGRDGGQIGDGGAERFQALMNGQRQLPSDSDMAMAAFIRNVHGEPIPVAEMEAAHRLNMDPRGVFSMRLPTGMPTRGLQVQNSQTTGVGGAGGFTIPGTLMATLVSAMKLYGPMMVTSEVWVTDDGRSASWPTCDDTANTGSQVGEAQDVGTAADLEFGSITFGAYKQTSGVLKASHELVRDSALNIATVVGQKMGERLGRIVNTKATLGSNGGGPTLQGIVPAATVGKTAASATAITMDELIELQHSVDPAYRVAPGVGWMMNDSTASYVRRLKDGNGDYLWQDAVQEGQPPRLLGNSVFINQDMASIATGNKTVLYGKLDEYKLRIVSGVRFRQLNERYAETDQVGFISFLECDGALMNASATASLCPVRVLQQA